MKQSRLFRLIDSKLDGGLDAFVASRRPAAAWAEICDEIQVITGETVNRETLRLWYANRIVVETKVRVA